MSLSSVVFEFRKGGGEKRNKNPMPARYRVNYAKIMKQLNMLMECYYAQNISLVPRIVYKLQNTELNWMENG